jgi:hypothetical protein
MVVGTTKVGKNGLNLRGEPKLCFSCSSPDHILPCPNNIDVQATAMQKLRDNPDYAKRIFKEFVVQMEDSITNEQSQQECIVIDDDSGDDDDGTMASDEKEATAFYIEHANEHNSLGQVAMDATDIYSDRMNALLDGNISNEDF